ncbi:MAG: hypothetical protein JOZ38_09240 [Candidatus Eremiobacteraeota bacterium]|nr:hypothetical protein [Candidatus Eremiobacteraeota bacterium]
MRAFFLTLLFFAVGGAPVAAAEGAGPSPSPTPSPVPSPYAQLKLRNLGPATSGGRLAAVAGTDRDASLYVVGSAGGGVWKSTNGGQDWKPIFDDERVASIGSVAIDPRDSNIIWVGTGEANPRNDVSPGDGIYRSSDGGKTWAHLGLEQGAAIGAISIDPRDGNVVVVAVLGDPFADNEQRGVYRTTDGGKTWVRALYVDAQTGASDVARSPKDPNVLYTGMWPFRRTGWSVESGGPQGGFYRSTDGGATWEKLSGNGLPAPPIGRIAVAFAASDPQRIYAIIQSKDGILWRSDDGGKNWKPISADTLMDERPFYFSHIFVDPSDENHVFSDSVHLAVSRDGGASWRVLHGMHGDHHAMWIAADGKRIIQGDDGGAALSFDGGETWEWRNTIPVGQLYHVGFDRRTPYRVCSPQQDNGVWCAANDSREPALYASDWTYVGGGDGTYVIPEPGNDRYVWSTSGGGNNGGELDIYDEQTHQSYEGSAYLRDQNVVPPVDLKYRFNWETPIAFDPFDPRVAYTAGNVVFASSDRAAHWKAISPDLTRNDRSHEMMTGGITLEGTGAETSETILALVPSAARRGMLWVGTDDGLVQMTLDGGKHWKNVTPPGIAPWGRFASISASTRNWQTAYAIYDRHMTGDRRPYVFRTDDGGRTWQALAAGIPSDEFVRSVREDPRNPNLVYLGTEFGLYVSFNRGAQWERFQQNLPPVSVRDIQVHPDANDLLLATHGRAIWVLDDLTPLQQLGQARAAGTYLFAVRPSYLYEVHGRSTGLLLRGAGQNPPQGAIVTFYLSQPAKTNPTAEILDSRGHVVQRFTSHEEDGKNVPDLSNQRGFNRFSWDLTEEKPEAWKASPDWNQFDEGPFVVPGEYTVVITVDGRRLQQRFEVRRDPRDTYDVADHAATYALQHALFADWSRIDAALNRLSTVQTEAAARKKALPAGSGAALASTLDAVSARAGQLQATISSNPRNDQDNDFLIDVLRERVQALIGVFDTFAPPSAEELREAADLHALTEARLRDVSAFMATEVRAADAQLARANLPSLETTTVPIVKLESGADASDRR